MSSVTQEAPPAGPRAPHPPRLVGRPLALTFVAEFASLTSFLLLVSVMPMLAAAAGPAAPPPG